MTLNKLAKTFSITTFHGTNADNLPNILNKGLLPHKPEGITTSLAVYLTNNIETAARYCRNFQRPVILELHISSPKRVSKLIWDPLDKDESLYDNYQGEEFYHDDIFILDDAINKILPQLHPTILPDEIEKFKGFNIYQAIKSVARSLGLNIKVVEKRMMEILPPQDLEYLSINESGAITFLPSLYDRFHQMYYNKRIPAQAIKAVHIPKDKLKDEVQEGKQSRTFGKRLIPADIRDVLSVTDNFVRRFYRPDEITLSNMSDVIDELDSADHFGIYKTPPGRSFLDELKGMRDALEECSSEEEEESIKERFLEQFQNIEPLDPGEVVGKEEWVRIPVDLQILKEVPSFYRTEGVNEVLKRATHFLKLAGGTLGK